MVQPNGMTRSQRRTNSIMAPYGFDRQGQVRTAPRGTGAKKFFGRFLDFVRWPILIKKAHEANVARKAAVANTTEEAVLRATAAAPPHGSIGFD